jgi:hypothetical protein
MLTGCAWRHRLRARLHPGEDTDAALVSRHLYHSSAVHSCDYTRVVTVNLAVKSSSVKP